MCAKKLARTRSSRPIWYEWALALFGLASSAVLIAAMLQLPQPDRWIYLVLCPFASLAIALIGQLFSDEPLGWFVWRTTLSQASSLFALTGLWQLVTAQTIWRQSVTPHHMTDILLWVANFILLVPAAIGVNKWVQRQRRKERDESDSP